MLNKLKYKTHKTLREFANMSYGKLVILVLLAYAPFLANILEVILK